MYLIGLQISCCLTFAQEGDSDLSLGGLSQYITAAQYKQGFDAGAQSKWDGRPRLYEANAWLGLIGAVDRAVRDNHSDVVMAHLLVEPDRDSIRAYPILSATLFSSLLKNQRSVEAEALLLITADHVSKRPAFAGDYLYALYFMLTTCEEAPVQLFRQNEGFAQIANSMAEHMKANDVRLADSSVAATAYFLRSIDITIRLAVQSENFFLNPESVRWLLKMTEGVGTTQLSVAEIMGLAAVLASPIDIGAASVPGDDVAVSLCRAGGLLVAVGGLPLEDGRQPFILIFTASIVADGGVLKPTFLAHGHQAQKLLSD